MTTTTPFPPAKLSANRAIGNWLAELSTSIEQTTAYDEANEADCELECLAKHIAQVVTEAYETGVRRGIAATADMLAIAAGAGGSVRG